jgi:hypothetical protein
MPREAIKLWLYKDRLVYLTDLPKVIRKASLNLNKIDTHASLKNKRKHSCFYYEPKSMIRFLFVQDVSQKTKQQKILDELSSEEKNELFQKLKLEVK